MISLIVPVYNVERYLGRCLESLVQQTYKNLEIILINDGSTDNSGKICNSFAKEDSRFKIVHMENKGVACARNTGIEMATGEFIGFVDSDDFIHPRMFEMLFEQAKKTSSDIVACDFKRVQIDDQLHLDNKVTEFHVKTYTNKEALEQIFAFDSEKMTGAGNNLTWVVLWNKIYKRDLFNKYKFENGRICEDELIIHKLLYACHRVSYITYPFYFYVQSQNSIIRSPFTIKRFEDKVYALKDRADFLKTIGENELHYKAYKSYIDSFLWNYRVSKKEYPSEKIKIKDLKRTLDRSFLSLIRNPLVSWKQKAMILGFILNPSIFEWVSYLNK